MPLTLGECRAAEAAYGCIQGRRERRIVGDFRVNLHPHSEVVAPVEAAGWPGAVTRHHPQQGIDPVSGRGFLCRINAVVDIGVFHLFRQRVGQGFQGQCGAVG